MHVGTCRISPDHLYLAYTLDTKGNERFMLQIKDLRSGCIIPNVRVDDVVSLAWAQDGRTLFYTLSDETQRPYRHTSPLLRIHSFLEMIVLSHLFIFLAEYAAQN